MVSVAAVVDESDWRGRDWRGHDWHGRDTCEGVRYGRDGCGPTCAGSGSLRTTPGATLDEGAAIAAAMGAAIMAMRDRLDPTRYCLTCRTGLTCLSVGGGGLPATGTRTWRDG